MAGDYESGGSDEVEGAEQALADVTPHDFMAVPPTPARPTWMVTRYPFSMDEFRKLKDNANQPDPQPLAAEADASVADADVEAEYEADVPEGGDLAAAPVAFAPITAASFEGLTATGWQPADCTCAAGPNDVLVGVNTDLAGYRRDGTLRFRWVNMTTLFRNVLPAGATIFDPVVAYDHYVQRWIVVVAARRNSPAGSWLLVGASQAADPAGAYWIWALDASLDGTNLTNNWADYPMLGFDTQAIYISTNQFKINGGFQYAKLRILRKAEIYAGGSGPNHAIRWSDFWNMKNPDNSPAFTVQPCVHFRGLGGNPPAYLVNALWPGGNSLTLWKLTNPIGFWIGGTSSLAKTAVSCRSYSLPPDAEQPDTAVRIETNDARLLNAVFQNVGGTQRVWTMQTSKITWPGEPDARSGIHWYEIDVVSDKVVQQNGYGAKGKYCFFPAIQTDLARNVYVLFGRSGASEYGSLRQTGRRVGDTLNDLQNSVLVKAGVSGYVGGRWGDYFGICRDSAEAGRVWGYGKYAAAGGNWGTWVCSMRF